MINAPHLLIVIVGALHAALVFGVGVLATSDDEAQGEAVQFRAAAVGLRVEGSAPVIEEEPPLDPWNTDRMPMVEELESPRDIYWL